MSLHKSSEIRSFPSCSPGRGEHCPLVVIVRNIAASPAILENSTSSVMHSSISIANENVSECIVAGTVASPMCSVAIYLPLPPDAMVTAIAVPLTFSQILAIPKSQIYGSPFPVHGQLLRCEPDVNEEFTSGETSTFLYPHSVSQEDFIEVDEKPTHLTVRNVRSCMLVKSLSDLPLPCTTHRKWGWLRPAADPSN